MSQTIQEATLREDEQEFLPEEVSEMATSIIEKVLGENTYSEFRVSHWTTTIIERILTELAKLKRPFKYVVMCSLQQKVGAGLMVSSCSYWEPSVDGYCAVKWSNDYIFCYVHVYGVQI
ncbi:UNVERIFIED_CONTAM: hypothetical protein PYX00_001053 [Menopon gallinae]|uniref:Dynein light chain Tctex-type 1 n=1 Tax=Menopon gallinae TaxID=328185 RepID=A0AAW2ICS7_9NEOP